MCFSSVASFSAGAVLTAVGILSLKKVESHNQYMFAAIPMVFGLQQITEGFVWLSLTNPEFAKLKNFSTYTFMVFAQLIWPFWVPMSIMKLEKQPVRKRILVGITWIGLIVSLYLGYCLMTFEVNSLVSDHHILYDLKYPMGITSKGVTLYFIAILFTAFFSSVNKMWILGLLVLSTFVMAKIFFEHYVISVWCFFAAVISFIVLFMMWEINKPKKVIS